MALLSDYVPGEVVYSGAETQVRRAVHRSSLDRVAIKMPVAAAPGARVVGGLVHEYSVLTRLSALPGLVRARELLQDEKSAALVLEDPGFRSLNRVLLERGRLPVEVVLRLGLQVARVLDTLHTAGLIHKDIKPHNVLVDDALERVLVEDFSIASWLSPEASAASAPEALEGTLAYISPEQTGRTARALDERTDLYSLGVMLFEMISGRRPFLELDPVALVHAHLAKEPPPLERLVPEVPDVLAAIVSRLLAKDPDRRYQTARGVAADLEEALRQLREQGHVRSFALGRKDFSQRLRLPQVLVGREPEVERVGESFTRAAAGASELVLIGGPSGIGKTALVRTVYHRIARQGSGLLVAGKHDRLATSTPYGALSQAFGALMSQWLASPPAVIRRWQGRIRAEVGDNARLIADVVPELDLVMGKLPPVPEVPAEQAAQRLKLAWLNLVRAVTASDAPLVVFLDDMQWADGATMLILQALLTDVERKDLLVIAAYRDNETPPEHPLWKLAEATSKSGVTVSRIDLGPLSEAQVATWLSQALSSTERRVAPLACVLHRRTRGNPFFLEQLLLSLHHQRLLVRDAEDGQWRWNQEDIEKADLTGNVVTLLTARVLQMPEPVQQMLGLAACAGHAFHLEDLERLSGCDRARVTADLWPALREELVVPASNAYRPAQALGKGGAATLDAEYRFLHDRVREACYERISPEQRTLAHLKIGRQLRTTYRGEADTPAHLLELVRHLNLGSPRMESVEERTDLARLNLAAARAAKTASAHRLMASLLDSGMALLGEALWRDEASLGVELLLERVQAGLLLREFDDVEARALALLELPLPVLPRLAIQELRLRRCIATGDYAGGQALGVAVLTDQGHVLPDTEEACLTLYLQEAGELERWFDRNPDAFDRMPSNPSPEHAVMDALMAQTLLCAAFGSRPMLAALLGARAVTELRRKDSLTPTAPLLIGAFAHLSSAFTCGYREAARWIEPAARAAARTASPTLGECLSYQGEYSVYFSPVDRSEAIYEQGIATGLKSGSAQATSWSLYAELWSHHAWRGLPLRQVERQRKARWPLMLRAGDAIGQHGFELTRSWCELLMNPAGASALLESEPLARGSNSFLAEHDGFGAELARIAEAHLFLVAGQHLRALSRARQAEVYRPIIYGCPPVADVPLWLAIAAAKCWDLVGNEEERARLRADLERGLSRLRYLTGCCPDNFLHKQRLAEAEYARVRGRTREALEKYDEAIELAHTQRFLHIEALAAQLSAEFHLAAGRTHVGSLYLGEARDAYTRWGALAVVAHLEAKYPGVLAPAPPPAVPEPPQPANTVTRTSVGGELELELDTACRQAQALSGELDPARVVTRLMDLVLESAGAQRGVLALPRGEAFLVVARLSSTGTRIDTGSSELLLRGPSFAATAVRYVARTHEPLVVGDSSAEERFRHDAHLQKEEARSVLALPLLHQGRLSGVLYLEHASPNAFSAQRVAFLSVLTAQAAIALENASLYAERKQAEADALFLAEASRKLVSSLDPDETLRQIAQIPVPHLCDASIVYAWSEREGLSPVSASMSGDGMKQFKELGQELFGSYAAPGALAAARVISGNDIDRKLTDGAARKMLAPLDLTSWAGVPLVTGGRGLGLLCLLSRDAGGYGRSTLMLAEELGRRAALALDNARLYRATQEAVESRDEFLSIASHELKTPLTSVSLQLQRLERRARQQATAQEPDTQVLAQFGRQIERLNSLVTQLLDVSLIQAGRLRLEREAFDLTALVKDVITQLEAQIAEAGCRVILAIPGAVDGRWDRFRIEQVVLNLLSNAIKYGARRPITVGVEQEGPEVALRVEDQGVGISLDDQRRLFERFERVESVRRHFRGLGLGLYISRQIVLAHGGSIRVESDPGRGARFLVRLPLQPETSAPST
jgi:signal transduction histidine kinase